MISIIKNILNILFAPKTRNFGVLKDDTGSYYKNYSQDEVVAKTNIASFKGINNDNSIRKLPYQYQSSSSSCVAHTLAKIATILYHLNTNNIVKWSSGYWYTQRANKPSEGMYYSDAVQLANAGAITEELLPSDGMNEQQINSIRITDFIESSSDAFKISDNWIQPKIDFNTVASTIEATKKGMMLWFNFSDNEFFGLTKPKHLNNINKWRHSVTAVDTATINGEKFIVIEDSADQERYYQKFINEDFFSKKCILSAYPINFVFAIGSGKPKFDGSIVSLQECLKFLGFFPSNLSSTGFFGNITQEALIKFQKAYSIEPAVGYFGDKTKKKLSELFN